MFQSFLFRTFHVYKKARKSSVGGRIDQSSHSSSSKSSHNLVQPWLQNQYFQHSSIRDLSLGYFAIMNTPESLQINGHVFVSKSAMQTEELIEESSVPQSIIPIAYEPTAHHALGGGSYAFQKDYAKYLKSMLPVGARTEVNIIIQPNSSPHF